MATTAFPSSTRSTGAAFHLAVHVYFDALAHVQLARGHRHVHAPVGGEHHQRAVLVLYGQEVVAVLDFEQLYPPVRRARTVVAAPRMPEAESSRSSWYISSVSERSLSYRSSLERVKSSSPASTSSPSCA